MKMALGWVPVFRVLKELEPRVSGVELLGKPKDSVWEDWGTLGKIRED